MKKEAPKLGLQWEQVHTNNSRHAHEFYLSSWALQAMQRDRVSQHLFREGHGTVFG